MSITDVITEKISGLFAHPTVADAHASTSVLFTRVSNDPMLILFLLAAGLSVCAFLMALMAFFRRPPALVGFEILEERLMLIENLLRDNATARAALTKKISGDVEYFRRELGDIRSSVETSALPSTPPKLASND